LAAFIFCGGFAWAGDAAHSPLASVFAGIVALALALPPLAAIQGRVSVALLVALAGCIGVGLAWLTLPIFWGQWLQCIAVAAAFAVAVTLPGRTAPAAAVVVLLGIAWLGWPIWLSSWLAGQTQWVGWLTAAHPLLSCNAVLIDQGVWTERPAMYGWTALNQDVSFQMPQSIWPCVLLHLGMGTGWAGGCTAVRRMVAGWPFRGWPFRGRPFRGRPFRGWPFRGRPAE
jgi:hypothetical protein